MEIANNPHHASNFNGWKHSCLKRKDFLMSFYLIVTKQKIGQGNTPPYLEMYEKS
jgi:hypothetical protein